MARRCGWTTTSVCVVSAVVYGLIGCAYSAQQRASGWLMIEAGHVQLRTNIGRGSALVLAREMQRAHDVLARYALPCAPKSDRDRVQVTALPVWQFEELAGRGVGGFYRGPGVTWLADYEGQIVIPDELGPRSKQVFQHEMTHLLVAACFLRAPAWLNEGLAGFFETMLVRSNKVTIGLPPYEITTDPAAYRPRSFMRNGQRIWILSLHTLPSLESMFDLSGGWLAHNPVETTRRYATAWALVHFLVLGAPDLKPRFEAYLAGLRTSRADPQTAFAKAFEGVPLQGRLNEYLRLGKFDVLQSGPSAVDVGEGVASLRVRWMQEEEGHLHLAWLSARSHDDEARERFRLHIAAAKQQPNTRGAAYLLAASALLADRDFAGAEREVQEGLRGTPDNPAFLEAHLDVLLARGAPIAELQAAAERLKPVAATAGQFCSLGEVAIRAGDRKAAHELSARGLQLNPRLTACRLDGLADAVPP